MQSAQRSRLVMLGVLVLSLSIGLVEAGPRRAKKSKVNSPDVSAPQGRRIALELRAAGRHDLRGQRIRCRSGEQVGIALRGDEGTELVNAVIEGCDIGVLVTGSRPVALRNTEMKDVSIGALLDGNGGTFSGNIISGSQYGIVVSGDDYTVMGNTVTGSSYEGILVTGDRNLIEGNTVRGGRIGINVVKTVPLVDARRSLKVLQDRARDNVIRANTALDNKLDIREFADDCEANLYEANVFDSSEPRCID